MKKDMNVLESLGSDLLYLILKSIQRLRDDDLDGFVLHPNYLLVLMETVEDSSEEDAAKLKHELLVELEDGGYLEEGGCPYDFMELLDEYFSYADHNKCIRPAVTEWKLYKIIKESCEEVKSSRNP